MANKTQGFQFRLTNVDREDIRLQTKQNVKKRIANIIYIASPPNDSINLEYVGSKESSPSTNIFIADRSDEIYANSRNNTVQEFIGYRNASSVPVANKNFLVTQEFIDNTSSPVPLYYKHWLSSSVLPESIRIFNKDFEEISRNRYKITTEYVYDEDTGFSTTEKENLYIFNSLESSYESTTSEYEIYFVQSTTRIGTIEETTTGLLDNEPAYSLASYDDFWAITTGMLKPWRRVYSVLGEDSYNINLSKSSKYAVRYQEANRVSIKNAVDFSDEGPWFPRVVNGGFQNGLGNVTSHYDIREFSNQAFNPIEPYKLAGRVKCEKISDSLVKLAHENIASGSLASSLFLVLEKDSIPQYAITDDLVTIGTSVYDLEGKKVFTEDGTELIWSNDTLLGVDRLSGIVHLDVSIKDSYTIYGTYTYTESYYTLSSLPMNPIFDPNAIQEQRVVYIVPRNLANKNSAVQTSSVKFLHVSPNGTISLSNQDGSGYNPILNIDTKLVTSEGYAIEGVHGLHYSWTATTTSYSSNDIAPSETVLVSTTYGFPKEGWLRAKVGSKYRYFKYIEKTDTSFILSSLLAEVPSTLDTIADGESISLVNFIDEYTVQTSRDSEDELEFGGEVYDSLNQVIRYPSIFSQYFVLAEMSINPPHGIHDLTRIDIRQDGGGIIPEKYEEAKGLNAEAMWLNDYGSFDGQVYPGDAVMIIKLPYTLLDDFTLDEIKAIAEENTPRGVYPLIRFYGYFARDVTITPSVNSVTIEWEKEGIEFVYDIWYSQAEDGRYTKLNTTRLIDGSGSTNTFESDIIGGASYLFKITMQDKYYKWWYGYNGEDSIEGGLGLTEIAPVPPFGNITNFQFEIL